MSIGIVILAELTGSAFHAASDLVEERKLCRFENGKGGGITLFLPEGSHMIDGWLESTTEEEDKLKPCEEAQQ